MDLTLVLFAQKGPRPEAQAAAAGVGIVFFGLICVGGLIGACVFAIMIWKYVTAYKALSAVRPRNREMEPGMVFLILIPFFGIVWYFFIIIRVANSLRKEFEERGLRYDGDFGMILGVLAPLIPCVGLVMHIMWILKIKGFTNRLLSTKKKRRAVENDDDEDDRPRKRRRIRDDDDDE